jgi:hypothetical protein
MDRREFLKTVGVPAVASVCLSGRSLAEARPAEAASGKESKPMKTWLFWDWWHVEHQDNVELCQGQPQWRPDGTYEDPTFDYLGFWPRVWQDERSGRWRMVYFGTGFPLTLLGAESDDGVRWRPMKRPDIKPPGRKYAPNHLFTVPRANGGPVYVDPVSADGRPFKFYCIQRGGPAAKRARLDPDSYFHEIVKGEGAKPYVADQLVATSADGLHWKLDEKARWGRPPWHPDPPINCFYNPQRKQHVMMTRPGWGDRRIAVQTSTDALAWSGPELLVQPDPLDPPQVQFYGMPVVPYEGQFVGFLWVARFSSSQRLERFNQLWGQIDCQLTYSYDGVHFQRGTRKTFVGLNEPGQPGSGVVYPTCLVERDDELRIYSAASRDLHHQYTQSQFIRKGQMPPSAVTLHTLRKDGFMYLASRGNWASLTTKPVALLKPELRLNALAPQGEIRFQATDLRTRPLKGFTFDDCVPLKEVDTLAGPIRWKGKGIKELVGKVIRLQVKFRHARLYAMRGSFHFLDALDVAMIEDGKKLDTSLFDF